MMGEKSQIIWSAETSFARRVALGLIVRRPVKPLLQMIPGMFIVDFLKRNQEIKRYSKFYLPPRRLALDAALALSFDEEEKTTYGRIKDRASGWLESRNLYSEVALDALMAVITLTAGHCSRLLGAEGEEYTDLVRDAYKTRDAYESFLEELLALEDRFIRTLSEGFDEADIFRQRLLEEQSLVAEQRKKETEAIFVV